MGILVISVFLKGQIMAGEKIKVVDEKGLWYTFFRLSHESGRLPDIVLLPVSHVAGELFIRECQWEEWCSDVVLREGITNRRFKFVARIYQKIARSLQLKQEMHPAQYRSSERKNNEADLFAGWTRKAEDRPLELVTRSVNWAQRDAPANLFAVRYVAADMSSEQLGHALRTIPFWFWWCLPVVGLIALVSLRPWKRSDMVDALTSNSALEDMRNSKFKHVRRLIEVATTERGDHLKKILGAEIPDPRNAGKTVLVRYGAAHIPAVLAYCREQLGYRIDGRDRVLAIPRDDAPEGADPDPCYGRARERFYEKFKWIGDDPVPEAQAAG